MTPAFPSNDDISEIVVPADTITSGEAQLSILRDKAMGG
jgi:hypothetical protein